MDLKQLEYFLQLSKFEHMSQTADFLGISQPTLSKTLSSLEAELGIQLFDRIGNRIHLNDNGRQFRYYAKDAIELLQNGIASVAQQRYNFSGNINIACWAYAPLLMPCISEYAVLNPNVNFNIIQYTHEVRSSTYDNDYDFILTSSVEKELSRQTESFWIPQALFTEGSGFLVIAPKHPLYEKLNIQNEYLDFDLIKSENFIGMKKTDILFDKKSSFQQSQRGIFLKSYFQADDFIVRAHALKDGLGIALIPEVCMEDLRLLVPGIKAFKLKNHTVGRTIILMRKKSSLLNESSLDFWDFVLNYYNIPHDEQL